MSGQHLDREFLERVLAGETEEYERKEMLAHLQSGCDKCRDFISNMDERTEECLLKFYIGSGMEKGHEPSLSDENKNLIFDSLRCTIAAKPQSPKRKSAEQVRGFGRYFLAAAAVLIIAAGAYLGRESFLSPSQTIKGGDAQTSENMVYLQFSVFRPDSVDRQGKRLTRGNNRGTYTNSESLLFRFQLMEPGWVHIVRALGSGGYERIFPASGEKQVRLEPGIYDAHRKSEVSIYPLSGLTGQQVFCAIYTTEEKNPELLEKRLTQALTKIDGTAQALNNERTKWVDCFQIYVKEPGRQDGVPEGR